MSKKAWIIFIGICVVLFGGLVALSVSNRIDVSQVDASKVHAAAKDSGEIADHVYGNAKSPVVFIEYGDYQCPGCGQAYPIIKNVVEKYKGQIAFIFRNFPLTNMHPNAKAAAAAAEAAGLQGKYWQMHDSLYTNQSEWESLSPSERTNYFAGLAKQLGLKADKFKSDMTSSAVSRKIAFDQALGKKLDVTGTPTFYIGDKEVDEYVKNGKIVSANTDGAALIWSSETDLENLIINPALKEHGIAVPEGSK